MVVSSQPGAFVAPSSGAGRFFGAVCQHERWILTLPQAPTELKMTEWFCTTPVGVAWERSEAGARAARSCATCGTQPHVPAVEPAGIARPCSSSHVLVALLCPGKRPQTCRNVGEPNVTCGQRRPSVPTPRGAGRAVGAATPGDSLALFWLGGAPS